MEESAGDLKILAGCPGVSKAFMCGRACVRLCGFECALRVREKSYRFVSSGMKAFERVEREMGEIWQDKTPVYDHQNRRRGYCRAGGCEQVKESSGEMVSVYQPICASRNISRNVQKVGVEVC